MQLQPRSFPSLEKSVISRRRLPSLCVFCSRYCLVVGLCFRIPYYAARRGRPDRTLGISVSGPARFGCTTVEARLEGKQVSGRIPFIHHALPLVRICAT